MRRNLFVLMLAFFVVGCAAPPPEILKTSMPAAETPVPVTGTQPNRVVIATETPTVLSFIELMEEKKCNLPCFLDTRILVSTLDNIEELHKLLNKEIFVYSHKDDFELISLAQDGIFAIFGVKDDLLVEVYFDIYVSQATQYQSLYSSYLPQTIFQTYGKPMEVLLKIEKTIEASSSDTFLVQMRYDNFAVQYYGFLKDDSLICFEHLKSIKILIPSSVEGEPQRNLANTSDVGSLLLDSQIKEIVNEFVKNGNSACMKVSEFSFEE